MTPTVRLRSPMPCIPPARAPDLIGAQRASFHRLTQHRIHPEARYPRGLQRELGALFPMMSHDGAALVELLKYTIGRPCNGATECLLRGITYSAPVSITLRVTSRTPSTDGTWHVRHARTHLVYIGNMPMMSSRGSFIVHGTERALIMDQRKSAGLFLTSNIDHHSHTCGVRVTPHRGTWLELSLHDCAVLLRINCTNNMPVTLLLKGLGARNYALPSMFTPIVVIAPCIDGIIATVDMSDAVGEVLHFSLRRGLTTMAHRLGRWPGSPSQRTLSIDEAEVVNQFSLSSDACIAGRTVTKGALLSHRLLARARVGVRAYIDAVNRCHHGAYMHHMYRTLRMDRTVDPHDARACIAGNMGTTRHVHPTAAHRTFQGLMEDSRTYCLSARGRSQINARTGRHPRDGGDTLDYRDIAHAVKLLVNTARRSDSPDDVDDMRNRRTRDVCSALRDALRPALLSMERRIRCHAALHMPDDLTHILCTHAITHRAFDALTCTNLSQPLDQTNPLAEVTHKRRVSIVAGSATGARHAPIGARDVHATHYGRLCPVETPEGQNIGLIASLAAHARIDAHGTMHAPYIAAGTAATRCRERYISPQEEEGAMSAPSAIEPHTRRRSIMARLGRKVIMAHPSAISFVDAAHDMPVSSATATIPFLEHNDACRALMGSNMERQAVPCVIPRRPRVHTGMELAVALHAGVAIRARHAGRVAYVDPLHIAIVPRGDTPGSTHTYRLARNARTNQGTVADHRPKVTPGAYVEAGDVIADGAACDAGELALGQDVLVAFMPWEGYNYEDSVAVSEALQRSGAYFSVHIDEVSVALCGDETCSTTQSRCIPGITQAQRYRLDERGVVKVGARVYPGDIIVGRISPRTAPMAAYEERLLRAVLGPCAPAHRDVSVRATPCQAGTVVSTRVAPSAEPLAPSELPGQSAGEQCMLRLLQRQARAAGSNAATLDIYRLLQHGACDTYAAQHHHQPSNIDQHHACTYTSTARTLKVAIAYRLNLQSGDKVSGRHGNKGVVSKVVTAEDMPYMKDGRIIDVILNPLGVPSRMNVGQLLETHLGLISMALEVRARTVAFSSQRCVDAAMHDVLYHCRMFHTGHLIYTEASMSFRTVSPAFNGPCEATIRRMAKVSVSQGARFQHGLHRRHQAILYDGRTGMPFDRPVTVGYMYYLKLNHLVRHKVHSRSTGPYSAVTEQPLGGKARMGGQRVGEMEVWALEAHGAAITLHEMLTVKSDDVGGRRRVSEHTARAVRPLCYGTPESISLLVSELRALCIDVATEPRQA
ncbi:DNA-directed RNA polymerase subunit beta [Candidatus Tremblaya princeps]|uniref:DNA-directed RNA polymerase subunit beta n=1 Tax=Tremblaya princeps TaxID=189385 RepID=A0A143WNQ6_TREPR|nr:DNA-directed RNA polymerase subunit beta [Candidatus Tremblaya princeps]